MHQPRHVHRYFIGGQPLIDRDPPVRHPLGDIGDEARPRGFLTLGVAGHGGVQIADPLARVAPHRHIRLQGATDLLGDDLQMNDRLAGGWQSETLGGDLAELAADNQQTVAILHHPIGDPVIAPEQAGIQLIGAGDRALAGHGVGHRDIERLGEGLQRFVRAGEMHAAAGQHHRFLGLGEQRHGGFQGVGRRAGSQARRRLVGLRYVQFVRIEREGVVADVFRHIQYHRPGPAGGRDLEGPANQFRQPLDHLNANDFLAGRRQDLQLAALLGHVLPGVHPVTVANDSNHRRAGIQRLDQPGHQIGGPRSQGRVDHADPSRHLGIGVGGESAAALVIDQRMHQADAPRRVVEGE